MPDSGLYVIVVGHNLEAKCDVANALVCQEKMFQTFSCRKKIFVRSRKTVKGKNLYIMTTPDIETPAWKHFEKELKSPFKFKTRVFLYVQDNDCIDSDDAGSIETLQTLFTEKVVCVKYNTKLPREDSNTSLDSFTEDSLEHETPNDQVIIRKWDDFPNKVQKGRKIMKLIEECLESGTPVKFVNKGPMAVDDKKGQVQRSLCEPSSSQDSETGGDDGDLGAVPISDDPGRFGEDDFSSLGLPCLDENDWKLYRRTLELGRARSNHVRVNIVGNQGAGKTSLVKRLQGVDVKCSDLNQRPTEGLEINQVTTRCIERDGQRYWEANENGYEQELNLQRMAFALQHAQDRISKEKCSRTEVETPTVDIEELEKGSEEVFEEEVRTEHNIQDLLDVKAKERYLQKVKLWKEIAREERMYVSYWDFAGQTTYYSTHQAFMAPSAVYVLVIDLTMDLDKHLEDTLKFRTKVLKQFTVEETVKFWISSIKAYTRDEQNGHAPFIIVGTHKDKVSKEEIREKFGSLRRVLKHLTQVEFVAIDNTLQIKDDKSLEALKNKILDLGLGVIDEEIPAQWINLENIVLQKKGAGKSLLKLKEIQELDEKSDMPMKNLERIEAFLEHEHRRGWLMHFCHDDLKDIIILDPDLLARYFNVLLRPNWDIPSSGLVENGIAHTDFIFDAAIHVFNVRKCEETLSTFTKILTHLHIMHFFEENKYFIPCLLPHQTEKDSFKKSLHREKAPILKLSFADAYVPPAFYHLLIAALNEDQSLNIYKKSDAPRIFNLFACFTFQRETLWLEVYWHECCVYFELKNYAVDTKINEPGCNKLKEVIVIIQSKIDHILRVYRQNNVRYVVEIECTKHEKDQKGVFVNLQKIRDKGEVMCTDGEEDHAITWDEISKILPWSPNSQCGRRIEMSSGRPSDRILGRLARHLSGENATSLASKLRLPQGNIEADAAISDWSDADMQRLKLLCRWKEVFPEHATDTLLNMLAEQRNYDVGELQNVIENEISHTEDYGLDSNFLDEECKDLLLVSDCIGAKYAFVMLELGLKFRDIEIKRTDNERALRETVYKLLESWRQKFVNRATPRMLLNTTKFLKLNTSLIVSKFKE
ncbi:uncharacterized protein LOC132752367 isoform X2 [Ruditapes philippinarum]|uniref:uncharacterized protein LOC132752367 isoform X2 n=1 Tax=Ruditapes philippinarum TaxID=129788 RepID=UPI00295B22A4|nr:uncharacterized protein LOC132752367 isoform X2 [Ruditapes philippinarum]